MSYEFGTNWARFADKTGPVIGPLMGYEVLTAFFLEAGFLGIMLFGRERVGPRRALRRHPAGRHRHADQRVLDPGGEFLDADAAGLHADPGRTLPAGRLVADHLQSVLPVSPRAHGDRILSDGRVRGRCGRRVSSAARRAEPGGTADVLDGDVDGGGGRAAPAAGRRPARAEHAAIPAGEDRRARGRLGHPARHAADPVRHAEHAAGAHRLGGGDPASRRAGPDP